MWILLCVSTPSYRSGQSHKPLRSRARFPNSRPIRLTSPRSLRPVPLKTFPSIIATLRPCSCCRLARSVLTGATPPAKTLKVRSRSKRMGSTLPVQRSNWMAQTIRIRYSGSSLSIRISMPSTKRRLFIRITTRNLVKPLVRLSRRRLNRAPTSSTDRRSILSVPIPFTQSPAKGGVPSGNWNQFGGTVGGPIRKNKLFAFGDYQGQRSHVGGTSSDRVPTALERGSISAGTGANLSDLGKNIYDPCTDKVTGFTAACNVAPANRAQFPGNVIPANRLSPQAEALLALIPLPNATPSTALGDNFFSSGNNTLDSNGFDVRSDFVATSKVNVFGRYSFQQFKRSGPGLFGVALGGHALPSDPSVGDFAGNSSVRNQSIATGFDYTLSPTLLTDIRFGYMRYRVNVSPGGFGTTPAKDAVIPGVNTDSTTSAMPAFTIQQPGASEFLFGYSLHVNQCNCPPTENEHQYQFVNNWTNIRGKHSIKFGADVRYAYNLRVPSDSHRAGQFDFNNDAAQGAIGTTPDGGAGLAGFLLGLPSHFERYVSNSLNAYETQPRLFFYGQDTIHWTSKLTVNLGLRWEIYRPESAAGT